ncbi:MAG: lytic transglycosylase domain-containing protein [Coriobacteriales bacterium]|nr:lytic transglycosylase domain-containing protein [Coriobacteriales bacterium]
MDIRNSKFFRWYRALPITLMALMIALSIGVQFMPIGLVRSLFFPVNYAERIDDAAARYGVDAHLIAAVIRCESGWNESAQSSAGAVGLMQLMPDTVNDLVNMGLVDTNKYNPNNLLEPATNIEYGTALIKYLQSQLSTQDEVIAAYNAGLSTVQAWKANGATTGIRNAITYPETYHYVEAVSEACRQYTKYYPTGMSTA